MNISRKNSEIEATKPTVNDRRFETCEKDQTVGSLEVRCPSAALFECECGPLSPQEEIYQCCDEYLALKAKRIKPLPVTHAEARTYLRQLDQRRERAQ